MSGAAEPEREMCPGPGRERVRERRGQGSQFRTGFFPKDVRAAIHLYSKHGSGPRFQQTVCGLSPRTLTKEYKGRFRGTNINEFKQFDGNVFFHLVLLNAVFPRNERSDGHTFNQGERRLTLLCPHGDLNRQMRRRSCESASASSHVLEI